MQAAEKGFPETPPQPFEEYFYFFYGTLMDRQTLADVLGYPEPPEVYPAKLHAYRMKLWGDYPAIFVDPFSTEIIHGVVYKVRSQEEEDRLVPYETGMYRTRGCTITFEDGSETTGRTFVWNAEMELLREGNFDLKH